MLSDPLFVELVRAASLASSGDNMQPWEFRKQNDTIEVFLACQRMLSTDVLCMFSWVSLGAAIQNIVVAAAAHGLAASVEYSAPEQAGEIASRIQFSPGVMEHHLADWIALRTTNRSPYRRQPLSASLLSALTESIQGFNAGIHWSHDPSDFERLASMDATLSCIRLEYQPLRDDLLDIVRFNNQEVEKFRYGLDFKSLEVPEIAVFFARQLRYAWIYKAASQLGIGRMIAKKLSSRLCQTGALCLVTAQQQTPAGYMEAGRAMEQLWLAATARGISLHPYGVFPQYLTKVEIEPETFTPRYAAIIEKHREAFFAIFPNARNEFPAIVLRVGTTDTQSPRSAVRLQPDQIMRQ